jgi:protein TonB
MAIGAPSVRPGSYSFSLALHGAAVVTLLTLSALGPEPLPTPAVAAAAPGPLLLQSARVRVVPPTTSARRGTERLPAPSLRLAPASSPTAAENPAPVATTIAEVADPGDGASSPTAGGCTQGCVVSGDPGPGDPAGVGSGEGPVVSIVPGGVIRAPLKLRDLSPIYPDLAVRARLEGTVEIECRIDVHGRVVDATVLRGHPILSPAALAAVGEWVYAPTLLNGVPVSVIMTVTVHFRLRH